EGPVAGRRVDVLDVRELIRRIQLGEPSRRIARDMGVARKTVAKYRHWAQAEQVLTGPLPAPLELQTWLDRTLPVSSPRRAPPTREPYRERILALRWKRVECQAILERLREEAGFSGSYSSVYRFVRQLEPRSPEPIVRVETAPGEEAQVDFGYAGTLYDP